MVRRSAVDFSALFWFILDSTEKAVIYCVFLPRGCDDGVYNRRNSASHCGNPRSFTLSKLLRVFPARLSFQVLSLSYPFSRKHWRSFEAKNSAFARSAESNEYPLFTFGYGSAGNRKDIPYLYCFLTAIRAIIFGRGYFMPRRRIAVNVRYVEHVARLYTLQRGVQILLRLPRRRKRGLDAGVVKKRRLSSVRKKDRYGSI